MRLNRRGNWTLIGLLVVAAIVVGAVAYYYAGGSVGTVKQDSPLLDQGSSKQTVVGKSIDTGKAEVCRQQLDQIRKAIETYKATGVSDQNPASLQDLQLGVSNTFFQCPVSGQPYTYDPAAGTVTCPTHPDK